MRVAAPETPEKEVFTLDPNNSLKKSFLWLFGQLVFLLLAAWGVFSHSTPGMILAVLSVILMLLCAFVTVFTISLRRNYKIVIVNNTLQEFWGVGILDEWDLLEAKSLTSVQFRKNSSDDWWKVVYGDYNYGLYLKREWLEFDRLLAVIEERSNRKFTDELL